MAKALEMRMWLAYDATSWRVCFKSNEGFAPHPAASGDESARTRRVIDSELRAFTVRFDTFDNRVAG